MNPAYTDKQSLQRHTCLFYKDTSEQKAYLLPFVREGLTGGEHCFFVCPDKMMDYWASEFRSVGVDVEKQQRSGALTIATAQQWRDLPFNSVVKARQVWQHIEGKLHEFSGVRIADDAGWAQLDPPITSDLLCHWEATADLIYEDPAVHALCMYDMRLHPPAAIRAALRAHATVIMDGIWHPNPYYEAPRILDFEPHLNASDADEALIERMLGALPAQR